MSSPIFVIGNIGYKYRCCGGLLCRLGNTVLLPLPVVEELWHLVLCLCFLFLFKDLLTIAATNFLILFGFFFARILSISSPSLSESLLLSDDDCDDEEVSGESELESGIELAWSHHLCGPLAPHRVVHHYEIHPQTRPQLAPHHHGQDSHLYPNDGVHCCSIAPLRGPSISILACWGLGHTAQPAQVLEYLDSHQIE